MEMYKAWLLKFQSVDILAWFFACPYHCATFNQIYDLSALDTNIPSFNDDNQPCRKKKQNSDG